MSTTILMRPAAVAGMRLPPTARVPRPQRPAASPARQRAYRRALRAAEMAAWEAASPSTAGAAAPAGPRKFVRLTESILRPEGDGIARALYAVIAFAAIAALVFGGTGALDFGTQWDTFVGFVRGLLR